MTSDARVRVIFEGDAKDLQRVLAGGRRDVQDFQRVTATSGENLRDVWGQAQRQIAAVSVAVGSLAAGVAVAKELVDAASNVTEAQNKVNEVFDSSAGKVREWAQEADQSAGLSERAALDAAGSFGNMFAQLGIGRERAGDMSIAISELAADFASFHNADISEVIIAQQAAFRGEYDAVQRFVPTINAAAVEQKALEMGLASTTKEISAQDKALAAYQLMIDDAGDAMGDFDRTSDGLANQQRILAAQWENVTAKLGTALLPAAEAVVTELNKILDMNAEEWGANFAEGVDFATSSMGLLIEKVKQLDFVLKLTTGGGVGSLLNKALTTAVPGLDELEWLLGKAFGGVGDAVNQAQLKKLEGGRGAGMTDAEANMEGGGPWRSPRSIAENQDEPDKPPRGGGGSGPKADWLSPETLAMVDALVARFPQFSGPSSMDERGLREFQQADQELEAIRASIQNQINELSLTLRDLDARGLELSPEFAALEDRLDGLKDASARIDLMADMKIEPFRDAMELVADSIDTVNEKAKKLSEDIAGYFNSQLQSMAQRNVRFTPGAWAVWAEAAGLSVPGGGGDVDVDVP